MRDWVARNPEKKAHTDREYHKRNKSKNLARVYEWIEKNPDKFKATQKAYRERNPEIGRMKQRKRRAIKRGLDEHFTRAEWLALCAQYDNHCLLCSNTELTADHVVPLSKGGADTIDNIQPLCKSHNSSKGTRTIDYRQSIQSEAA